MWVYLRHRNMRWFSGPRCFAGLCHNNSEQIRACDSSVTVIQNVRSGESLRLQPGQNPGVPLSTALGTDESSPDLLQSLFPDPPINL
jgi:hypothetical protein